MPLLALVLALSACASGGTTLKWNRVDREALMNSEAGKMAYNTFRFSTRDNRTPQLCGYLLAKDGIEVQFETGSPFEKLGKMTLRDVMADYQKVLQDKRYTGAGTLHVQEYFRRDAVVGYAARSIDLDVSILDVTQGEGSPVLRVGYRDVRPEDRSGKLY